MNSSLICFMICVRYAYAGMCVLYRMTAFRQRHIRHSSAHVGRVYVYICSGRPACHAREVRGTSSSVPVPADSGPALLLLEERLLFVLLVLSPRLCLVPFLCRPRLPFLLSLLGSLAAFARGFGSWLRRSRWRGTVVGGRGLGPGSGLLWPFGLLGCGLSGMVGAGGT